MVAFPAWLCGRGIGFCRLASALVPCLQQGQPLLYALQVNNAGIATRSAAPDTENIWLNESPLEGTWACFPF